MSARAPSRTRSVLSKSSLAPSARKRIRFERALPAATARTFGAPARRDWIQGPLCTEHMRCSVRKFPRRKPSSDKSKTQKAFFIDHVSNSVDKPTRWNVTPSCLSRSWSGFTSPMTSCPTRLSSELRLSPIRIQICPAQYPKSMRVDTCPKDVYCNSPTKYVAIP